MPSLDMTEVLLSPEFQDTFSYVRSSRTINVNGVAVDNAPVILQAKGVVVPDPSSLTRQSDGSRVSDAIDIYTQEALTEGYNVDDTNSINADVATWNGRQYVVGAVSDFSNFGQGFFHANATLINLNYATDSQGDSSGSDSGG